MKLKIKSLTKIFKSAYKEWMAKDPFREAAVIAYYAIFSLPGLLVVIITLAGYFFGREIVNGHVSSEIERMMGNDTADQVNKMIAKATESKTSLWASIIGVVTILIGATGVFAQFQKSLNIIWEVKADTSKKGIWSLIRVRVFSFGLILSIAFILIVSLVVSTMLTSVGTWMSANVSDSFLVVLLVINFLFSVAVLAVMFALMFKFFPDAKIKWRFVWVGSVVTALLFETGKFALSLYFGKSDPGSGYGTAGSMVLILLWVFYSSMIVFFGAEFTRAFADHYQGNVPADKHAVKEKGRER